MDDLKTQGIKAKSQQFKRFEQVTKTQDYHLAETAGAENYDDDYQIQVCDMRALFEGNQQQRQNFIQQLGDALKGIGFAILSDHGIDTSVYQQTDQLIRQLFTETDETERLAFLAQRHGSVNQGYFPAKQTTIIHPDLVQGWVFCRRAFNMENDESFEPLKFWPKAEYEKKFRQLCLAQEKLILPIMQCLLAYLGCDPHLYDKKLSKTNFGFRLNFYPPINEGDLNTGAGRMLGHEDVDLFTLLPAPEVEGLQVLNRKNMKWIRLKAPPGSIILNTGDYMQRISNDIFPSTTHRVAQPSNPACYSKARISFPMAVYVWEDEILEVLPGLGPAHYKPVSAIKFHTAITSKYYGEEYAVEP